ncbi:MAG: hypothetical protein KC476_09785 [Cyanobacteria bacterium HKST-UBA06]|nr:hypothetical protein [Cyanobacteria bacterium HKST-UBA06]
MSKDQTPTTETVVFLRGTLIEGEHCDPGDERTVGIALATLLKNTGKAAAVEPKGKKAKEA